VVFTSLFALGLIMIVQAADQVDLDPGCVLYGAIELTPLDTRSIAGWEVPRVVVMLSVVLLVNLLFVLLLFKELKITSFDPALATSTGFHAGWMHYLLMTLVAVTAVASFESVGNILVVAMFVVPPAAAYMLTDRLSVMIALSGLLAVASAVLGHVGALVVPAWLGYRSTTTAGMMAVAAGGLFLLAALFAPRHGVLIKLVRHWALAWQILAEDVIGLLYRMEERLGRASPTRPDLQGMLMSGRIATQFVLAVHRLRGVVRSTPQGILLTDRGRRQARGIVRSHRLWEHYLVSEAGVRPERIHDEAEQLEHFTDRQLRHRLDQETAGPQVDPHGRPIPPENDPGSDR
ncbi:MAG: iron dependent repressor, metal binding and dimerization domain protein, partial [Pirellulales bacterium]